MYFILFLFFFSFLFYICGNLFFSGSSVCRFLFLFVLLHCCWLRMNMSVNIGLSALETQPRDVNMGLQTLGRISVIFQWVWILFWQLPSFWGFNTSECLFFFLFFLTGRSSNNIGSLALNEKRKKLKYPNLKICLLHALIYFVYQIVFFWRHNLFHQLEMCIFLILPSFFVVLYFNFLLRCTVWQVELPLQAGGVSESSPSWVGRHSRSVCVRAHHSL